MNECTLPKGHPGSCEMSDATSKDDELDRRVIDYLILARSRNGEGRRDLQELLPVHRDLVAFIKQYGIQERIDERKKVEYSLEVAQDIFDADPAFVDEFLHGFRVARREVEEDTKDRIAELTALKDKE